LADATRPATCIRKATGADVTRASPAPDPLASADDLEDAGGERRHDEDGTRQSLALRAIGGMIGSKRDDLVSSRALLALAEVRGCSRRSAGRCPGSPARQRRPLKRVVAAALNIP